MIILVNNMIKRVLLQERNADLVAILAVTWQRAVMVTHTFLSEQDIKGTLPTVIKALAVIDNLYVKYCDGLPVGFIGIADEKIEMLYVHPDHFKKGVGKELLTYADEAGDINYVDVYEQNTGAVEFYKHYGFVVYDRIDTDDMGRPFAVIKLKK